jgi:ABC-2 type transport system permease protein
MFSAMLKKETILILRDKKALIALFLMPSLFILIISVAMRDIFIPNSVTFDLVLEDFDKTDVTRELIKNIKENSSLNLKEKADIKVVIPDGFSANKSKLKLYIKGSLKSDEMELFKSQLLKEIASLKLGILKERLAPFSQEAVLAINSISFKSSDMFDVTYNKKDVIPNSTEQSVPSWIVFGMFFMITPISTIFINERKQNTLARLKSMNVPTSLMIFAKITPYLFIAQLQAWLMFGVGKFVVPLFDTPALSLNGSVFAFSFLSFGVSLASVGLASIIAVFVDSTEQASTIGGILSILLGAIGGVMVPKFIMPDVMQTLANISPMSWGLDGFLEIFLNGANVMMILDESIMLILFGLVGLFVSIFVLHMQMKKGM